MADLAASMPRLQAFIYVSTCYVNAHRPQGSHVEEAIFPLVRATSGGTVQHAELAAKLANMPPAKAQKAVSLHMRLEWAQTPHIHPLAWRRKPGCQQALHAADRPASAMEASAPRTIHYGTGVAFQAITAIHDTKTDFTLCMCRLKVS